jgi:hypothetical protein
MRSHAFRGHYDIVFDLVEGCECESVIAAIQVGEPFWYLR